MQLKENFTTAGNFVLDLKISWEPGDGQWLGALERAWSSTVGLGDGNWGPRVPLVVTWSLLETWPTATGMSADFWVYAAEYMLTNIEAAAFNWFFFSSRTCTCTNSSSTASWFREELRKSQESSLNT